MGMLGGATAGLGLGQQWANNPNINYGNINIPGGMNVADYLSHADPLGNQITKLGGDPLNLYGNKNNPNALLFPSNPNGANGSAASAQFPNLGASSLNPVMPGGMFQPLQNGQGLFNNMASQGAGGMTYNPAASKPTQANTQQGQTLPPQGSGPMTSLGNFGSSYGRGYQQK